MNIVHTLASISSLYLWGGLIIALVIFGVISAVLVYHWKMYGLHHKRIKVVQVVYFIGSAVLLCVATISLLLYTVW